MKRKSNIETNREIDRYRKAEPGSMSLSGYLATIKRKPKTNMRINTAIKRYRGGK